MKVPIFQVPGLTDYLSRTATAQERADMDKLSKITANHSLLLQSSGGKVWEVKVSDTGVLSTTQVA